MCIKKSPFWYVTSKILYEVLHFEKLKSFILLLNLKPRNFYDLRKVFIQETVIFLKSSCWIEPLVIPPRLWMGSLKAD